MKKTLLAFAFCLMTLVGYTQENFSMETGKVTQYEMSMTSYEKDSEAEAVVIYENGDYRFLFSDGEGLKLRMTKRAKIKILSQAGEKYATFEIPIYVENSRSMEELEEISGITYNYDGQSLEKTEFETKGNVFDEKINDRWIMKKFTLPNVKVGSIIEVKYTISSPFFFNMREWNFQKRIPVVYSSLKYRAIPYYEYIYTVTNINKFDEFDSRVLPSEIRHGQLVYQEKEFNFGMKDIPAFRDEEFISAPKNYMVALNFQLAKIYYPQGGQREILSTWEALTKDLQKSSDFGKYIDDSKKEARKILPTLGLEEKTEMEKIKIISDYVKSNFNWNGYYGETTSQKVSNLMKTKRGSVADINLFLVGLFLEAKLDAIPIISSTRANGIIQKSYPFMHYFNYALAEVKVGDTRKFVDATEPLLANGELPARCVNTEGLAIEKAPRWVFIAQKSVSYLQKNLNVNIISADEVIVNANYAANGGAAYNYRAKYLGKTEDLVKYLKDNEDVNIEGELKTENYQELGKIFKFNFQFKTKAESGNDKIFINPFSNLFSKDNLFKQSSRTFPVEINEMITRRFISTINIPEGYELESMPESLNFGNDVMQINYKTELVDGKIKVDGTYSFKDYAFPADKYTLLKNTYAKMLSKFTEMIVFAKKK